MGMFSGMNEAKTAGSDAYLTDGTHKLKIEMFRYKKSENRESDKEASIIVEFTVLESTTIEAGKKRSWILGIPAKAEGKARAYGDVRSFLVALAGSDDPDFFGARFESIAEAAIGANNPLRNMVAEVVCQSITTKAGKPFTKHKWQPSLPAQAAVISALGSNGTEPTGLPAGMVLPPGLKLVNGQIVPA